MTQAERDEYYRLKRTTTSAGVESTNTFWYFIVGGIVGAILIVLLIFCLVRMVKKNALIVAKVEKLEEQIDKTPGEDRNDDFYNSRRSQHADAVSVASVPNQTPFQNNDNENQSQVEDNTSMQVLRMQTADLGRVDRQPSLSINGI